MLRYAALLLCLATQGLADSVVPVRTIRANAIIAALDVTTEPGTRSHGFARIEDVVGQEARQVLYPGRPITAGDIGPPALVARNQVVTLRYEVGGLKIATEARAMERGAEGDMIRAMNLSSRTTLFGQVQADGSLRVTR